MKKLMLVCLLALGCDTRSSGGTVIPTDEGVGTQIDPKGEFEGESIDELKIRLDRLSGQQEQLIGASSSDAGRCEELCELARSICEVKTKMCEIADERVSDDEYQNLCRQAKQRCQRASDSCVRCVQTHERSYKPGSCAGDPAADKKPE
ncbi:MAG TPA: hypothetical protein VK034_03500 [Enhygromyxa sp.]|nr:hypothetical protein [Enhygromyxa sp.]